MNRTLIPEIVAQKFRIRHMKTAAARICTSDICNFHLPISITARTVAVAPLLTPINQFGSIHATVAPEQCLVPDPTRLRQNFHPKSWRRKCGNSMTHAESLFAALAARKRKPPQTSGSRSCAAYAALIAARTVPLLMPSDGDRLLQSARHRIGRR